MATVHLLAWAACISIISPLQRGFFLVWVLTDIKELPRYEGDNFVLDGQVVRAAGKLCNAVLSSTSAVSKLSITSAYLRLLSSNSSPPPVTASTWHDVSTVVLLLEWRAALMAKNFTKTQTKGDVDANVNQRLAKAVTEAFVAVQVGEMISNLIALPTEDARAIGPLYRLVSFYHRLLRTF
jgi:acyl-CoA oxidase